MTGKSNPQLEFRNALGSFATGVTIATTKDSEGNPVGVTASSFNSVSLDPPLVLWSLAKSSHSRAAFCESGHFAVHVLAASQEELSNKFARSGADKFDSVDWREGELGSPVFTSSLSEKWSTSRPAKRLRCCFMAEAMRKDEPGQRTRRKPQSTPSMAVSAMISCSIFCHARTFKLRNPHERSWKNSGPQWRNICRSPS